MNPIAIFKELYLSDARRYLSDLEFEKLQRWGYNCQTFNEL